MKKYGIRTVLIVTTITLFITLIYSMLVQHGSQYVLGVLVILLSVALWGPPIMDWEDMEDNAKEESKGIGKYLEGLLKRDPDALYDKPCHDLGFCPYGSLIEEFPLREGRDEVFSCKVFGHDCPVFYCGSLFAEDVS